MKKTLVVLIALIGMAAPALAAGAKYFLEIDTVGNCSVVDSKPSASAGMKILGDKNGIRFQRRRRESPEGVAKRQMQGRRRIAPLITTTARASAWRRRRRRGLAAP